MPYRNSIIKSNSDKVLVDYYNLIEDNSEENKSIEDKHILKTNDNKNRKSYLIEEEVK